VVPADVRHDPLRPTGCRDGEHVPRRNRGAGSRRRGEHRHAGDRRRHPGRHLRPARPRLVLLYKGNRIFNFTQAEFGSIAGLVVLACLKGSKFLPEIPYVVAIPIALLVGTGFALLTERW
jgi:hypothetical protein